MQYTARSDLRKICPSEIAMLPLNGVGSSGGFWTSSLNSGFASMTNTHGLGKTEMVKSFAATRMLHFTLTFDAKAWAKWATAAGVDPRGVAFVLNYPETVTGKRTTPRTLVHFCEQIQGIKDLKTEIELVATLAAACLDETSVAAFVSFVNDELSTLLHPEDILDAKSSKDWQKPFSELAKGKEGGKRVDRIAAICTRLFLHVTAGKYQEKPHHAGNFAEFLLQEAIPNDLRGSLMMDLSRHASAAAKNLLKDKRLAKLLFEKL